MNVCGYFFILVIGTLYNIGKFLVVFFKKGEETNYSQKNSLTKSLHRFSTDLAILAALVQTVSLNYLMKYRC